jgi:hypothetical protein
VIKRSTPLSTVKCDIVYGFCQTHWIREGIKGWKKIDGVMDVVVLVED